MEQADVSKSDYDLPNFSYRKISVPTSIIIAYLCEKDSESYMHHSPNSL